MLLRNLHPIPPMANVSDKTEPLIQLFEPAPNLPPSPVPHYDPTGVHNFRLLQCILRFIINEQEKFFTKTFYSFHQHEIKINCSAKFVAMESSGQKYGSIPFIELMRNQVQRLCICHIFLQVY